MSFGYRDSDLFLGSQVDTRSVLRQPDGSSDEPASYFQVVIAPQGSEGDGRHNAEFLHGVIGDHVVVVPTFALEDRYDADTPTRRDAGVIELVEALGEVASVSPHGPHEVLPHAFRHEHYDPLQNYDAWSLDRPEIIRSMHNYFRALINKGGQPDRLDYMQYTPEPDNVFEPILLTPRVKIRALGLRALTLLAVKPKTYRVMGTYPLGDKNLDEVQAR